MAKVLGLPEEDIQKLEIAGNLHDLGKLIISDAILLKQGRLTREEYATMKAHSYYTYQILYSVRGLEEIAEIAGYHHERENRTGYPFHLKAEDLPLKQKLLILSDVMTAIMEDRPYRKGMAMEQIREVILPLVESLRLEDKISLPLLFNLAAIYEHIRMVEENIINFYTLRIESLQYTGAEESLSP